MRRPGLIVSAIALAVVMLLPLSAIDACCPAPPAGKPVLNADQTVLIIWDAPKQTQHFIRRASFLGDADDFGFLVPTPSEPELAESGNEVFPILARITAPEIRRVRKSISIGCAADPPTATTAGSVRVLQEELVGGFQVAVLAADSASALVDWLRENGYAHTPQIEAWAEPYVKQGWKLTALKIAQPSTAEERSRTTDASALRISFQTDVPLFPYREPDSSADLSAAKPPERLLRIYMAGEGRFRGDLAGGTWTGRAVWSGAIPDAMRGEIISAAGLSPESTPATWWLTEFEDQWPYAVAPSDLTFRLDSDQGTIRREPTYEFYETPLLDLLPCFLALGLLLLPFLMILRTMRRISPSAADTCRWQDVVSPRRPACGRVRGVAGLGPC